MWRSVNFGGSLLNRSQYLADLHVRDFLEWVRPKLSQEGAFLHEYLPARGAPWSCRSLFDAYEGYEWPFSVGFPGEAVTKGRTVEENRVVLERLSEMLRASLSAAAAASFYEAAAATLRWGGVFPRNGARLLLLGDGIVDEFTGAADQLQPSSADTDRTEDVHLMNAGFTKIYSLLLDGFPIYDGRVGATLGYLVRLYCEDGGLSHAPGRLRFARGVAKGVTPGAAKKNRNPSSGTIRFPALRADVRLHTNSNLMAAWLLGEMSEAGRFADLPPQRRMRALESALFMVGYELPPGDPAPARG